MENGMTQEYHEHCVLKLSSALSVMAMLKPIFSFGGSG
jgi:hypothetical protein